MMTKYTAIAINLVKMSHYFGVCEVDRGRDVEIALLQSLLCCDSRAYRLAFVNQIAEIIQEHRGMSVYEFLSTIGPRDSRALTDFITVICSLSSVQRDDRL